MPYADTKCSQPRSANKQSALVTIKQWIQLYHVIREITTKYGVLVSMVIINYLPHLQHYLLKFPKKRQNIHF